MDKLALGLSLISLLYIALFFAIRYAMGLLEEWNISFKKTKNDEEA
ncbi:hypothetical protein [Fulvivirga kasyanovii]|nr:hypothetical protein [Fulvivirga kasyanovii]